METIKTYLENMFMNLPDTPEVSKAKAELLSMMEDKYNELKSAGKNENEAVGIVISEFGNLEELASSLGLESYVSAPAASDCKKLNADEAKHYITLCKKSGIRVGIGVMLCILCPTPLIILGALTETTQSNENVFAAAGVILMLIMVAIAVAIFIIDNSLTEAFDYIKKEPVLIDSRTQQLIKREQELTKPNRTVYTTVGVVLYIISAIPILSLAMLDFTDALSGSLSVISTLLLVSIATFLCIRADNEEGSYKSLLEEGKFANKTDKILNEKIQKIQKIYWRVILCIYLGYSFLSHDWGRSWIIWPVAGVLSGLISAICKLFKQSNTP